MIAEPSMLSRNREIVVSKIEASEKLLRLVAAAVKRLCLLGSSPSRSQHLIAARSLRADVAPYRNTADRLICFAKPSAELNSTSARRFFEIALGGCADKLGR
jgi:hypothetical protein